MKVTEAFSHLNVRGQPAMVDVSGKGATVRSARARSCVKLPPAVSGLLAQGELHTPKGPVFQTAIIAGTLAAKRTHELIPFCHAVGVEGCEIEIRVGQEGEIIIDCETRVQHKTGVEMEALTGALVAALTVYDMCKSVSDGIVIEKTYLLEKRGGKSDYAAVSLP